MTLDTRYESHPASASLGETLQKTALQCEGLCTTCCQSLLEIRDMRPPEAPPTFHTDRKRKTDEQVPVIQNSFFLRILDKLGRDKCYCMGLGYGFLWYNGRIDFYRCLCSHQIPRY